MSNPVQKKSRPAFLVLTIICLVAALALAGTNAITKGPILEHAMAAQREAFGAVMTADEYNEVTIPEGSGVSALVEAKKDGKTYVVIHDYDKLREAFGQLLTEVQRIKSTGDYEAAKQLVESYGVKVDADLHKEILDRFAPLNIAPYRGFVNPRYVVTTDDTGAITDVQLDYTEGYVEQMMRYSKEYSSLPSVNN